MFTGRTYLHIFNAMIPIMHTTHTPPTKKRPEWFYRPLLFMTK